MRVLQRLGIEANGIGVQKLGVSQPTASVHLKLMTAAGLLTAKKVRQWTFYKRNERSIRALKSLISKNL